ncbi:MAG: STAS domain-containing protein [Methanoregula sp.]|nr:STAS domain-containing protein [Methanoregula sp.]
MVLDISIINSTTVITLTRRFDSESAPVIEIELKKILEQHPESVLFDFTLTEYIASAGLRVLLSTTRTVMKAGGKVALSSLTPQVRQVFEIAGFTKIFSIYGTRDEAIRSLQKK